MSLSRRPSADARAARAARPAGLGERPTPDGLYGYKVVFRVGPLNGFDVSRAEVHVRLHALRMRKGTCTSSDRHGRCVRRLRSAVSLFRLPACPVAGRLTGQLLTAFAPPAPSLTTRLLVPCPRYVP